MWLMLCIVVLLAALVLAAWRAVKTVFAAIDHYQDCEVGGSYRLRKVLDGRRTQQHSHRRTT